VKFSPDALKVIEGVLNLWYSSLIKILEADFEHTAQRDSWYFMQQIKASRVLLEQLFPVNIIDEKRRSSDD